MLLIIRLCLSADGKILSMSGGLVYGPPTYKVDEYWNGV